MTLYDQVMQFLGVVVAVLGIVAGIMLFGAGIGADVTALTARSKRARAGAVADIALTGGDGILFHYALRKWRKRKRRRPF